MTLTLPSPPSGSAAGHRGVAGRAALAMRPCHCGEPVEYRKVVHGVRGGGFVCQGCGYLPSRCTC